MSQAIMAAAAVVPCMLASSRSCALRGLGNLDQALVRGSNAQPSSVSSSPAPRCPVCSQIEPEDAANKKDWREKVATRVLVSAFAAGVVFMNFNGEAAVAAQSGGRVGGQAFRSAPPPRSASPPRSAPRINNSRTNIFINPPSLVAPPLPGYGYGSPFFGGWSPFSFYVPGPSLAVGIGGGFEFFGLLLAIGLIGTIVNRFRTREDDDY